MSDRARALPLLLVTLGVGACAPPYGPPVINHGGPTREQFLQFAGPPVDRFTWIGRYYAFTVLGKQQVVVWTTINDAYLLTVTAPCVGLDFVNGIHFTSSARTVTRGVDGLLVDGQKCFITEIRPVDYRAMKKALHTSP